MAFSHTHTRSFSSGSSTVSSSKTYSADGEANLDATIPASSTNLQINVAVDVSELESLFILCDVAATIYVNDASTGSPTKTIPLAAGEAYQWPNGGETSPLGASDVTEIFVTCSAGGTLQWRSLVDPTP